MNYSSEILKIIQAALSDNKQKVISYANFYADKLEADGEKSSADRVRQIIKNPHGVAVRPMANFPNAGVPIPRVDAVATKTVPVPKLKD
jgi:hypothetical protein